MVARTPKDEDFWDIGWEEEEEEKFEQTLGSIVHLDGLTHLSLSQLFAIRNCLWLCLDQVMSYCGWMHLGEMLDYARWIESEIWRRKKAEPPKEPG